MDRTTSVSSDDCLLNLCVIHFFAASLTVDEDGGLASRLHSDPCRGLRKAFEPAKNGNVRIVACIGSAEKIDRKREPGVHANVQMVLCRGYTDNGNHRGNACKNTKEGEVTS